MASEATQSDSTGTQPSHTAGTRVSAPQPNKRKKRGHYVNLACYECKKRKTKCDSTHPCSRCAKSGKKCMFPPIVMRRRGVLPLAPKKLPAVERGDPWSQPVALIATEPAQEPHRELESTTNTWTCSSLPPGQTGNAQDQPEAPLDYQTGVDATLCSDSPSLLSVCSTDIGHTPQSAAGRIHTSATAHYKFNISLARTNLRAQGVFQPKGSDDFADNILTIETSRIPSPALRQASSSKSSSSEPMWSIDKREAFRLCDVYEEEINISHPFLDMKTIRNDVMTLYESLEVLSQHGCSGIPLQDTAVIGSDNLKIIKMVFATALITEISGPSKLAKALFDDVKSSVQSKFWEEIDIPTIIIFFLLAMWQFLADNDSLAWRLTGIVARWCLEIGLNRSLFIRQLPGSDHDRKMAVRLFWCIHILDRRWGFGNGLPFVIQDSDIDESFPEPDGEVPYLRAMVSFSHIMSTVWYTSYNSSADLSSRKGQDEASYLDFRITKWWDDLPTELQLSNKGNGHFPRGMQRLRVLLYLRKCQLRILLHQPVLHSAMRIRRNPQVAEMVVELAKDVIRTLDHLNRTTDIYSTQQMCFNYFLVLSLGVILLAISQTPDMFADKVRQEFYAALDLVQSLSSESFVSGRLWKYIRGLKSVGDTLKVMRPLDTNAAPGNAEDGEQSVVSSLPVAVFDLDMGLPHFTDDMFHMLPPFQTSEEVTDTGQLMENMWAVFEVMGKEWSEGAAEG